MTNPRRSLEDMIEEVAGGLLPQLQGLQQGGGLRPVSLDLALPVEAQVVAAGGGLRVIADVPRLHTRTDFDLPVGKLTLSLGAANTESLS